MLDKLNVKPNIIRKREKDDYKKLLTKEVDIFPAYMSNEPYYFKKMGKEIKIVDPKNYGFDFYGDLLFTNENEAKNHPLRVKRFKEATLKGWNYALENKEEIIQLIKKKYNTSKSIEHLRYEANVIDEIINKDVVPLGSIDEGRVRYIHELYKEYGLSEDNIDVKDFIFEGYRKSSLLEKLTKEEKDYLINNPILRVQNLKEFPPFNFNEDNKPLGYTVDYINLVSKYTNLEIEFISNISWAESLEMLKNKKLDLIPHIAINESRKEYIDFTNFKHIDYIPGIVSKKNSNIKFLNDLKNKTVAVVNKSFIHTLFKNKFPSIKLYLVSNAEEAIIAVSTRKADATVDNLATLQFYIDKNWLTTLSATQIKDSKIFKRTNLFMGVSKGNHLLKSILQKIDDEISYEEKISLRKRWSNSVEKNLSSFSSKEIKYLRKKKKLNMCIHPNLMPFEKIENGKHVGITADYMKIFQEELHIPIKLVKSKNFLETLEFTKNKKCDFITSMSETKEGKKSFNFTNSLMEIPIVLSTKMNKPFINNLSDIKEQRLGIVKNFEYISVLKEKFPNIELVEVDSTEDGLKKVLKNEIYGFIGLFQSIGYNIQKNHFNSLKIAGMLSDTWSFSMAVRNDEPLLKSIFDKVILNISEDTHNNILHKWVSIKLYENINYTKLVWISIVFLIIILIIVYKNKSINKLNIKMQKFINLVDENVITSSTDIKGNIIDVSKAFCDISGYSRKELLGKNHRIIKHPDIKKSLYKEIWKTITSGKTWKGEIKNKTKNGGYYWVSTTISPEFDSKGNIVKYVSIRQDITDKKRVEEISITDELTTLSNKRHFNEMFLIEINRAKRDERIFGFLIFDIDHFKQYNDNYGHQKGDQVLEEVGKAIQMFCKRSSDFAFRIGGEEFGIIFSPQSTEYAVSFAQKLRENIENLQIEHKYNSISNNITVSIGLYVAKAENIKHSKEIYKLADEALYQAKKQGRNKVVVV